MSSESKGSGEGEEKHMEAQPIRRAADMDEDEASMLITGMFRRRIARNRVRLMAHAVFEKAYDETTGCFFYFNRRTQTSHWEKPKVLGEDDVELTPRSKEAVSQAASRAASRRSSADDGGGSMVHDSTHGSVQGSVHGSGQGSARGSSAGTHRQSVAESLGSELSLAGFLARHGLLQYRDALEEDGFDDMEALLGIEPVDMDALGMRTGHKRKLLRALREIDMTPRYDDDHMSGAGRAGAGMDASRRHRESMAAKLKLDLRRTQQPQHNNRRTSIRSGLSSGRRRSLYSDDHGTASHRSGRMYAGGDEDAHSEVSGPALTAADTVDADDIEMSLETVFDGDGTSFPTEGQVVRCHYKAMFEDGTEFESSRKRGRAFQFKLGVGQVIEAWDIAISQMSKGQRARFTTPPELAYGVEGRPPVIPPNATLTFEVELIEFFEPEVELTPREYYEEEAEGPDSD